MPSLPPSKMNLTPRRRRRPTIALLVLGLLAAGMATATPAAANESVTVQSQQTGWQVNDDPVFGPDGTNVGWRAGDPASRGNGHGPAKYFNNSNYAYASAEGGWNPNDSWARWEMGRRVGTQEIQVFVPGNHASANVTYLIEVAGDNSSYTITTSDPVEQADLFGWHSLGNWSTDGHVTIEVRYQDSRTARGRTGALWRSVGIDAVRMRCVSSCSSTSSNGPPTEPRSVSAAAHGTRQIRVTWSPPSNTDSAAIKHYRVRYSRPAIGDNPAWSRLYTTTSTSHTSGNLRYGTTYTVTVTAVNRDDLSSRSATDTATTRAQETETTAPSPPRNVDAEAHGQRQIRVTWSPPSNTGSAAIKHYRVRYSRPAIGNSPAWRSRLYTTTSTSHTSGNLRYRTTYTVTVTAVNRDDLPSRSATDTATTRAQETETTAPRRDGCPTRNKYTRARDGLWPSPHRITSQQQFETISGTTVRANTKGGIVSSGNTNLAQDGCSWIGFDAEVVDGALVSENALVIGEAKVSSTARIYGHATVSGNAWVRGQARVYGEALVTDHAIVEGTADISGKALIVKDMRIDSGKFDGEQEYERTAREIARKIRDHLTAEHRKCWNDEDFIKRQVDNLLNPPSREWYNIAEATYQGCKQLEALRTIMREFTPSSWELVFGYAAGLVGTLRLPLYARSLLTILEGVENMRQIKGAGDSMASIINDLEEAYDELP